MNELDRVLSELSDLEKRGSSMEKMQSVVGLVVDEFLDPDEGNPLGIEAYRALLKRGDSEEWARDEIARVILGTLWYVAHPDTERLQREEQKHILDNALIRLKNGERSYDIYPPDEEVV